MSVAVSIHRKGRLAWVILDRPARRNVLDRQTLEHLAVGARELAADATVAAILLRGEGGHFSAGADIDALAAFASPDEARVYAAAGQDACAALEHAPVPVIAAIRGSCVGGGLELALSCDFRFAAPDATFGQVELGIGSVAAWGGIRRLPRVVGVAAAKQLVYTADHVDAAAAHRLGLVNQVVDDRPVEAAAEALGERFVAAPRQALAASKRALDQWLDVPLQAGLEQDLQTFAQLAFGTEFREGVARFLQRRER